MRVWLVNTGEEIPSDAGKPRLLRTGIMAERLARRGHEVTWWNSTVNHQRKEQRFPKTTSCETPEGYRLILLHGRLYRKNISIPRIVSQIENAREFARVAPTMPRPDVILCGYPPIELAKEVVAFAQREKIPVAIDFRDMWPDVIVDYIPPPLRWAAFPVLQYWNRSLRFTVKNASAIVGVTDGFVDWALERADRKRGLLDRAFHLAVNPTPPEPSELAEAEQLWDGLGIPAAGEQVVGCFAGTLSRRLDIKTLVNGAVQLPEADKERLKIVICGKGDQDEELRNLAQGQKHIVFGGWRNAAEIHVLLRRCHFGVVPYFSTADFVRHYPNKVGEYLGAGLPIMTGLHGQVRTLLQEHKLGYFYEEGNAASAAECLKELASSRSTLEAQRAAARQVYDQMFDAVQIYDQFCEFLEQLAR